MYKVFIDGKEGTTGLGIFERIHAMNDCELLTLSDAHRKDAQKRRDLIHQSDITFLCLPDDAARESVALAQGSNARIIDASTAHRTDTSFIYGLPELGSERYEALRNSKYVAVPGCHASGFIALTLPLIKAGIINEHALLHVTSLTGYSGGGKSTIAQYEDNNRPSLLQSPRLYATAQQHKHIPEMLHLTGLKHAPVFNPIIADFYRGMLVMVSLHAAQLETPATPADIQAIYSEHYRSRPVIRVNAHTGGNGFLAANALAGTDAMELSVAGNEDRYNLIALYDNLGKGASGAAVQCMNIMLGKYEAEGLTL